MSIMNSRERKARDRGRKQGKEMVIKMLEDMKCKPQELVYDVTMINSIIENIKQLN